MVTLAGVAKGYSPAKRKPKGLETLLLTKILASRNDD